MDLSFIFISIVAPLCVVFVALSMKDSNKRALKQNEEQLQLQKENNNLLREILVAIKEKQL